MQYTGDATALTIPATIDGATVERIDKKAFADNQKLTQIVIPDTVKVLGKGCFSGCSNLESVIIPSSIKNIPPYAFESCESLRTVTIPDSVFNIEQGAFDYCPEVTVKYKGKEYSDITVQDIYLYACEHNDGVHWRQGIKQESHQGNKQDLAEELIKKVKDGVYYKSPCFSCHVWKENCCGCEAKRKYNEDTMPERKALGKETFAEAIIIGILESDLQMDSEQGLTEQEQETQSDLNKHRKKLQLYLSSEYEEMLRKRAEVISFFDNLKSSDVEWQDVL